jgi:RHS Repeat.
MIENFDEHGNLILREYQYVDGGIDSSRFINKYDEKGNLIESAASDSEYKRVYEYDEFGNMIYFNIEGLEGNSVTYKYEYLYID